MGPLWEDAKVTKVFHGSEYDMRMIKEIYGPLPRPLEDTKILAELVGAPRLGLDGLLEDRLGVRIKKTKSLQRADWAQRPLRPQLLEYAAGDVRHLLAMRDDLHEALKKMGRAAWFEEESRVYQAKDPPLPEPPTARTAHRIKGAKNLTPRQRAVLEELFMEREAWGKRRNTATFRLVGNDALLKLAQAQGQGPPPKGLEVLPRRMPPRQRERFGKAVERALAFPQGRLPRHDPPRKRKPPRGPPALMEALREAREKIARKLGIDPGVVLPGRTLVAIAKQRPRSLDDLEGVEGIRAWQVEVFGERILEAVRPRRT